MKMTQAVSFTTNIKTKLHATTLVSMLVVGVTAAGLSLAFRELNREYELLYDLHQQRSVAAALGDLTSGTVLLLERAI